VYLSAASQVSVYENETGDYGSSILNISSSSKGILIPRMSTSQQIQIINPAIGLLVFNLDSLDIYIYDGSQWLGFRDTSDVLVPISWNCSDQLSYGGQNYTTVQIGSQCWMAENLNVGTMIEGTISQSDNGLIEKHCYNNEPDSCDLYGGLYKWDEVMQYSTDTGIQGICPPGWHIPTDEEWKILEGEVDSQYGYPDPEWNNTVWRGFDAGDHLRSSQGWFNNENGSDTYGFNAMAGGTKSNSNYYYEVSITGRWWSSTMSGGNTAWYRAMQHNKDDIYRIGEGKSYGFSVRCLKDSVMVNQPPGQPGSPIPQHTASNQSTSAQLYWSCSDPDGDPLTYDVYFGTETIPALVASSHSDTSYNPGILEYNTTYYWYIVASDGKGIVTIGPVWSFSTSDAWSCGDSINHMEQSYGTVLIGTQCWMAENLNIGTMIVGDSNQTDNDTIEKYCYNDVPDSCDVYGGLYQWDEMMQYVTDTTTQGVCPDGWHIPTDFEWKILEGNVDSYYDVGDPEWNGFGLRGTDAGYQLKSASGWYNSWNGPDSIGFSAMPGGINTCEFIYSSLAQYAYFWSSDIGITSNFKLMRRINWMSYTIYRNTERICKGFSVRCVKNDITCQLVSGLFW
jgi:uncharacterized protein (TIGR02145 family)